MEYVEETVKVHEEAAEKKLLDTLAGLLGSQRFDLWFGRETVVRLKEEKVVFEVKNRFAVDWIRTNFQREIEQACKIVFERSLGADLVVRKTRIELPSEAATHAPAAAPALVAAVSGPHFASKETNNDIRSGASFPSPQSGIVLPSVSQHQSPLYSVARIPEVRPEKVVGRAGMNPVGRTSGRRFATLRTFVEGLSNRLACRAADLAIHHPGQINPIYLFGPSSVGKTHLLEGIWTETLHQPGRKPPLYLTTEQFVSSFLESIQPGSSRSGIQGFRNKFKGISILLVDDIQYLYRKDATQTEFLFTIDSLRNQGVQLVLTGDRPLRELTGLRREIICRLEAGMVCGIEQPEREMSLRIFKNMVEQRQLPIGPEVCRMVTSRLGAHARQLSGALNRLHAVYLSTGEPITLETAEESLGDLIRSNRRNVRLQDIEKAVCETFGLSEESLQSKSRAKQVSAPRMLAMWLARKYTRSALSEIGRYFGDRSHSTVVTAQKKVDRWVDENHPIHAEQFDVPISEAIRKIEQMLQSG